MSLNDGPQRLEPSKDEDDDDLLTEGVNIPVTHAASRLFSPQLSRSRCHRRALLLLLMREDEEGDGEEDEGRRNRQQSPRHSAKVRAPSSLFLLLLRLLLLLNWKLFTLPRGAGGRE